MPAWSTKNFSPDKTSHTLHQKIVVSTSAIECSQGCDCHPTEKFWKIFLHIHYHSILWNIFRMTMTPFLETTATPLRKTLLGQCRLLALTKTRFTRLVAQTAFCPISKFQHARTVFLKLTVNKEPEPNQEQTKQIIDCESCNAKTQAMRSNYSYIIFIHLYLFHVTIFHRWIAEPFQKSSYIQNIFCRQDSQVVIALVFSTGGGTLAGGSNPNGGRFFSLLALHTRPCTLHGDAKMLLVWEDSIDEENNPRVS